MNKGMCADKKLWTDPALVVLVRNRPEEAVLSGCKTETSRGGVDSIDNACTTYEYFACYELCQVFVSS